MAHSDDEGLVLRAKLASLQVVIIPVADPEEKINEVAQKVMRE